MSEKSPEAVIKDGLDRHIRCMILGEQQVADDKRRLRESERRVAKEREDAKRHHAALLVLNPSTPSDFDTYVANFKRANPL